MKLKKIKIELVYFGFFIMRAFIYLICGLSSDLWTNFSVLKNLQIGRCTVDSVTQRVINFKLFFAKWFTHQNSGFFQGVRNMPMIVNTTIRKAKMRIYSIIVLYGFDLEPSLIRIFMSCWISDWRNLSSGSLVQHQCTIPFKSGATNKSSEPSSEYRWVSIS